MGKYSTKPVAGAQKIETRGGDYAQRWDDGTHREGQYISQYVSGAAHHALSPGRTGGNCSEARIPPLDSLKLYVAFLIFSPPVLSMK